MKRLIDVSRFAIKDSADTKFSKVADIVFESVWPEVFFQIANQRCQIRKKKIANIFKKTLNIARNHGQKRKNCGPKSPLKPSFFRVLLHFYQQLFSRIGFFKNQKSEDFFS